MRGILNSFIDRLNYGQSYLFLGQKYLTEYKEDYYDIATSKLSAKADSSVYLSIEESGNNSEDILQWLQSEADYLNLPSWGKYLAMVPWNGIMTSSVEYFVEKMLKMEMREIQPIYQFGKNLPYNFKSKKVLHISYLYGCLNQIQEGYRPPISLFELSSYKTNALMLLNRINKEFLSPVGMLVVDGYDPYNDWVNAEMIYSVCCKLAKEQVFFFSFKKEYLNNPYIKKLVDNNIVVPIYSTLVETIEQAYEAGAINDIPQDYLEEDLIISVNDERKVLSKKLLKRISRTFKVLDDYQFEFENLDLKEQKEIFREFLYKSSIEPVWEAYHYKMNIVRQYEDEAYECIISMLKKDLMSKKAIVIHGQTGTGKTVALASLAYRVKKLKKYPVIYIDCKTNVLNNSDIEELCAWCPEANVAVFWDAAVHGNEISKYIELNDYLSAKGKKAVIIGTSYSVSKDYQRKSDAILIEAPIEISNKEEISNFKQIYEKYSEKKLEDIWTEKYDNNFLVALYRLLPNTNYNIRRGLIDEVSIDTVELSELLALKEKNTPIMELLAKCGIPITMNEEQKSNNEVSIRKIIRIVSVVGQYGIAIPFEILYRMLNEEISYLVGRLLDKIDFLHVELDTNGNVIVFPRNTLEAHIISNSSMLMIEEKVKMILEIIGCISEKEIAFLISLLKAIGPNSNVNEGFESYYYEIAQAVSNLRINEGIFNESTVIQEASYVREYFKNGNYNDINVETLVDVQQVLINEIEKIEVGENDYRVKNIYGQLLMELSSNFGTELWYHCKNGNTKQELVKFESFKKYLEKALIYSPDAYYPVDVFAWVANEIMKTDVPEDYKTELYTKLLSMFGKLISENPDISLRTDYNRRIILLDALESRSDISREAFARLYDMGSDAGIYLYAKKLIKNIDLSNPITEEESIVINDAIEYLEKDEFHKIVYNSEKCLYLIFRLMWMQEVREPLFFSEKKVLTFSKKKWMKLYSVLLRIDEISEDISVQLKYFIGVAEFHLGDEYACFQRFDELRYSYDMGRRRPILYIIVADGNETSEAKRYTGQLKEVEKNRDRAKFYIPALRRNLYYYNREFVSKEHEINEEYKNIHIGFSFMGPRISEI